MSGRPPAQVRPGFIKVCLCPEVTVSAKGTIRRRDLTVQCSICRGFAALERCLDCEDRGVLGPLGQRRKFGRLWRGSAELDNAVFFGVGSCETCRGRGYVRTDRKVDPYAQKAKK